MSELKSSRLVRLGDFPLPTFVKIDWQSLMPTSGELNSSSTGDVSLISGANKAEVEHIFVESLPLQCRSRDSAIDRIWELSSCGTQRVLVRCADFPGETFHRKHVAVAPLNAWFRLFESAGLSVEYSHFVPSEIEHAQVDASWLATDPYRSGEDYGETLVLLKRNAKEVSAKEFKALAKSILGGVSDVRVECNTELTFLLGHYQEFLQFEPFFECVDSDNIRVLIRDGAFAAIEARRLRMIESYLRSRNIRFEHVGNPEDVQWNSEIRQAAVTAIDSTATPNHLINSAFLLEFSSRGVPTFQLQHGLWPHSEFDRPLTFLADYLLQWSDDYVEAFRIDGDDQRVVDTGCPRFDAYADQGPIELSDLLGDWVKSFRSSIFLATNLHWPLHAQGQKVLPELAKTSKEMPDTLFICKLHPAHEYDPTKFQDMPTNVVVIDEFASLQAGLNTPRLLRACDEVVCTLGTVVLESVLASKIPVVLDTGNQVNYRGIATLEIPKLGRELRSSGNTRTQHQIDKFVETYYSVAPGDALERVVREIENSSAAIRQPSGLRIASCAFAKEFLAERMQRQEERAELQPVVECAPESEEPTPIGIRKPSTMSRITREIKRLQRQVMGVLGGKTSDPIDVIQVEEIRQEVPVEMTSSDPVEPLGIGELKNRNQIPKLLDQLGLKGFGVELGVAAAEYSDIILREGNLRLLFSIDRWSDHHDDEECAFAGRVLSKYGARSVILKMTFEEASKLFADHSLDFIYLDGYAHTGQDGIATLETWWNKLKPGGLFAGHDYHEHWPETQKVVDSFVTLNKLEMFQTLENPEVIEHAFPSWYVKKSETIEAAKAA